MNLSVMTAAALTRVLRDEIPIHDNLTIVGIDRHEEFLFDHAVPWYLRLRNSHDVIDVAKQFDNTGNLAEYNPAFWSGTKVG